MKGTADPAFAAHEQPIGKWAEAVWYSWLPLAALQTILDSALLRLGSCGRPWAKVFGPGAAFVASAQRIGWTIHSAVDFSDELGVRHSLFKDSPAMVSHLVRRAVWSWRWKRFEVRHPHLKQAGGGHGPFIEPLFRLLQPKDRSNWTAVHRGAFRSALLNRQWPQVRLFQAGKAQSSTCQLCVAAGLCADGSRDPKYIGTLLHRILSCEVTADFRREHAPQWILDKAARYERLGYRLSQAEADLLTRGLVRHPGPCLTKAPQQETFQWIVPPPPQGLPPCTFYVDGSRLFSEHKYFGLAARHGWALLAVEDATMRMVASAHGVPPTWADGIQGAELWGMLQASQLFQPGDSFRLDCLSVKLGVDQGPEWAGSAARKLARAWIPLANALHGSEDQVVWMPAHCADGQAGHKLLGNGMPLRLFDIAANDYVDGKCKQAARAHKLPFAQLKLIRGSAVRAMEAGRWVGKITALANHFPNPCWEPGLTAVPKFIRDSSGFRPALRPARPPKRKQPEPSSRVTGDLSLCPRWAALRARIVAKSRISEASGR